MRVSRSCVCRPVEVVRGVRDALTRPSERRYARALVYYTSDDESTTAKFRRRRRRILAGRASLIGRLIAHGTSMQVKRRATQVRRVARAPELS